MTEFQLKPQENLEDYGSEPLVWPYNRSTAEFAMDASFHGLPVNVMIIHFEAVAEDGSRFLNIRGLLPAMSANQRLWGTEEGTPKALHAGEGYSGPTSSEYEAAQDVLTIAALEREFSVEVSAGGDRIDYVDLDRRVEIAYERLGPGVRMLCPGIAEDVALVSEHFRVTGTVL
ncbi:MAG: hypothetical protein L0221_03550, partial [Chloroflexi bacterium]|nr:hypothetical protein [Chloroflexota bacterium]